MNTTSLTRWSLNRLIYLLVGLALAISWWSSSLKYEQQLQVAQSQLLTSIIELGEAGNLGQLEVDPLGNLRQGEFLLEVPRDWLGNKVIYRGGKEIDGQVVTIVLAKHLPHSWSGYFFTYLFISLLVVGVVLFLINILVIRPLNDDLLLIKNNIMNFENEKYNRVLPILEVDEIVELFESWNKLSLKVVQQMNLLRGKNAQWEVFFSTMPRGLVAIDRQMNILNCNENALRLLNITDKRIEEVAEHSVMSLFRNVEMNNVVNQFFNEESALKEYEFQFSINNIQEDIKVICVELQLAEDGEEKGAIIIIENITALRRLENMRKDFVSNVTHELKTPIAVISGFTETLKDCLGDPESSLNFLKIIEKNTTRLNHIIDDLLSLSKLEQNEAFYRKDFEYKNISETIRMALDVCIHEAKDKGIEIKLDLEDSQYYEQKQLLANHRLLEQALRNLIENAIRYSPAKSSVTISTRKVRDELIISVKDNGAGIAKMFHEKIFERFYRIDKSRDRSTGGSGLGLAIVKHIMRVHEGRVKLESVIGKGSTFSLILPYTTRSSFSLSATQH